jgi:hypothetical protein
LAGFTNRGKLKMLTIIFQATTMPTNFFVALCTSAVAPTQDTNTLGQLTQIASGNGYTTNGISLTRNTTDFDTPTEDDTGDLGSLQIKDLVWTASGGPLPASGNGARWAVLTDDNATPANREVWAYFDLVSDRTVSVGQTLTLQNCELRLSET